MIKNWINTQQQYYLGGHEACLLPLPGIPPRPASQLVPDQPRPFPTSTARRSTWWISRSRRCSNTSGTPPSGMGGWEGLQPVFSIPWPPCGTPATATAYGTNTAFSQRITDGWQTEAPDNWLRYGNFWEFPRAGASLPGPLLRSGSDPRQLKRPGKIPTWTETDEILAMAYDYPVPGYQMTSSTPCVSGRPSRRGDFNLEYFNQRRRCQGGGGQEQQRKHL